MQRQYPKLIKEMHFSMKPVTDRDPGEGISHLSYTYLPTRAVHSGSSEILHLACLSQRNLYGVSQSYLCSLISSHEHALFYEEYVIFHIRFLFT